MDEGDISGTSEKISNNINNTNESYSGRVVRANKDGLGGTNEGGLGRTDKSGLGGTDLEAGVGVGRANKGGVDGANIEAGNKASASAVASTDNAANGGVKVTDRNSGHSGLAIAFLAPSDCANNSNFAVPEKTPSSATTSISDDFLATFAALTNKILERKSKVCESNPFLFAANHQWQLIDNT